MLLSFCPDWNQAKLLKKALKPYHRHGGSTVCHVSLREKIEKDPKIILNISLQYLYVWDGDAVIFVYVYKFIYICQWEYFHLLLPQSIILQWFHGSQDRRFRHFLCHFAVHGSIHLNHGPICLSPTLHEIKGEWSYRSSYDEDSTYRPYLRTPIFWEKKSHLIFQWKPPTPRIAWRIWWFPSLATVKKNVKIEHRRKIKHLTI